MDEIQRSSAGLSKKAVIRIATPYFGGGEVKKGGTLSS
jgi:hypothetical protein